MAGVIICKMQSAGGMVGLCALRERIRWMQVGERVRWMCDGYAQRGFASSELECCVGISGRNNPRFVDYLGDTNTAALLCRSLA